MLEPIRQACILVGGMGTRLGDMTRSVPKPLLEIAPGVSFLDIVIEQVARQGFTDVVLLAGYLGHLVRERVLVEPEPRGTGGALAYARAVIAPRFLLLNGDSFFNINIRALAAQAAGIEALVALRRVSNASRYGTVDLEGNRIVHFREKASDVTGSALINTGVYVVDASVLDRIRTLPCSIERDVFPVLAQEGRLAGDIREGYFLDIGLPETLERGRRELLALRCRPAAFLDRDGVLPFVPVRDRDSLVGCAQNVEKIGNLVITPTFVIDRHGHEILKDNETQFTLSSSI
jgi:NDP-sugar pyrophosphorylase family protein